MEVNFQLRERTALIAGPFSSTMQKIVMDLCALGVDCFVVTADDSSARRFCQGITDLREINRKSGRAAAYKNDLSSEDKVKDAISEAVKTFGSVDLLIDMNVFNRGNRFVIGQPLESLDQDIQLALKAPMLLAHQALGFFKSRQRGRILFLMNERNLDPIEAALRGALISFSEALSRHVTDINVTVNVLSLGLTEEWVLAQNPNAASIKEAVAKLKESEPGLRITEPDKIASTVAWLMGQYGATITGQFIKLK